MKLKTSTKWSILICILLMGIIAIAGWNVNASEIDSKTQVAEKVLKKEQTISLLWQKAQDNKAKVEAIDKIKNAKQISEAELKSAINVLFKGDQERALKVQNCENGKRIADRFYTNTKGVAQGSKDVGIWQVNNYFHNLRVQKLFSKDFWSAMIDPARNTVYAAILHNQQGNLSAWACNTKV